VATVSAAGTALQRWQAPAAAPRAIGYGLTVARDVRRVEVPEDLRCDLVIGQGQPLRCFEEALRYVMVHADHDVRLVHGFVVEDGRPRPHGWAEIGDEVVYCPTVGQLFDRDSYAGAGAAGGKALSNLEAAAEVGKVRDGAALATGAAAAPVVGAGLVANQLYERFGEDQGQGPDGVLGSARQRPPRLLGRRLLSDHPDRP
jgi:hypothetical protein